MYTSLQLHNFLTTVIRVKEYTYLMMYKQNMQLAIETYLNKRSSEFSTITSQFNSETAQGINKIIEKYTHLTNPTQPPNAIENEPEKGKIEIEAEKQFEALNPKPPENAKKRKHDNNLGPCVYLNRNNEQCCKKGFGLGENKKWFGKVLCSQHYNTCRIRCYYKGCSKFAHLCKEHDQNKPAAEKFDDKMIQAQKENDKEAELKRLNEEKEAELKRLNEEKEFIIDFNESEVNDEMSDFEDSDEDENEIPKAAGMFE